MKNTISKRIITLLVIVTFLMPVSAPMLVSAESDPVTETSITRGIGTYKDPYQIWNVSQLSQIPDSGSVVGSKHTGGIVGYMHPNQALIKDCYFEGSVSGHLAIGGLVFINSNCKAGKYQE